MSFATILLRHLYIYCIKAEDNLFSSYFFSLIPIFFLQQETKAKKELNPPIFPLFSFPKKEEKYKNFSPTLPPSLRSSFEKNQEKEWNPIRLLLRSPFFLSKRKEGEKEKRTEFFSALLFPLLFQKRIEIGRKRKPLSCLEATQRKRKRRCKARWSAAPMWKNGEEKNN